MRIYFSRWWVLIAPTTLIILGAVARERDVTADAVCGALCGFLLLGLAFGHLYCVTESLSPGAFRVSAEDRPILADPESSHFLLTYFRIMTLTTVGYGDITPVENVARDLAAVEAVLGQFYIAVLVAELIGKRGRTLADNP